MKTLPTHPLFPEFLVASFRNIKPFILFCLFLSYLVADTVDTRFNYFGNIAVTKLNKKEYTLNNYIHDNVDNKIRFSPYSKLGGQFSAFYNDYTFTIQALARKDHNKYKPDLTWLNLKYNFNENFSAKLGRIQTSLLLNSNSLDIDYIHLWSRAPDELYRLMGINDFNGIEFMYKKYMDNYSYNIILTPYGRAKKNINTTDDTKDIAILDDAKSIKFNFERDNFTFQGSYTKAGLDMPNENPQLKALTDALRALGNDVDRFSYVDKKFRVWTIGLKYDYENFIFNSEFARMDINSLLPDMSSYFVLFGYRFNKFEVFYMFAENKADKKDFDTSNIITTQDTRQLKVLLDDVVYSTNTSQKTSSIGFKYNIQPGIALKGQIDRTTTTNYGREGSLNKRGILEYELGANGEPIYTYTLGLSFAF